MRVITQPRRRSMGGLFNTAEVNQWCDNAANIWPGSDREALRAKCKKASILDPWTAVGKLAAGLPANFSTDPNIVAGGAVNAVIGQAKEGVGQVVAIVNPTATQAKPKEEPGGAFVGPSQIQTGQASGGGFVTTVNDTINTWVPASARSKLPLILGVGIVGVGAMLFLTRKKRAPALSGYHRKRRSRRSRRSRR